VLLPDVRGATLPSAGRRPESAMALI